MDFTAQTTSNGVSESHFTLNDVPGVLWSPAGATGSRPLVLLAHGGGQHKLAPGIVARAQRYVTACGFSAAAIDAPGHGDRPRPEDHARDHFQSAIGDWQSTLAALRELGLGPVGFWGVSLGTGIGIQLAVAEPDIAAAVFGLASHERLAEPARQLTLPIEFLVQWDDELVPRDSALALFDAFGSQEKTLHANPGSHVAVPRFEVESSVRFFQRHLSGA